MEIRRRIAFLAALLAGLTFASSASAATITVSTTTDDVTPNDGSVSLREAISAINAGNNLGDPDIIAQSPGVFGVSDTIDFALAGAGRHTILPGSVLPTLTKRIIINGTSQPGSSANTLANGDNATTLILLNGASAGANASGLSLGSGSEKSSITGLDVFGFGGGDISIQSNSNTIAGNDIGFDLGGGPAVSSHGVLILNASSNLIGGLPPASRNLISGNFVDGVEILSVGLPAVSNTVQGNFIGTGPSGTNAVANGASAPAGAGGGVQLIGANNDVIGGTAAGARNVISGNGVAGILLNTAQNDVIQGNFVGIGADGVTPVPNATGVWLVSPTTPAPPTQNNLIGGTVAGSGNLIASNSGTGVIISGATANGDGILGNAIYANGGLGIDLGNDGVTPDSPGGPHIGPNNLQNFPVITAVTPGLSTTTIEGTLNATPSTAFRLEFFSNAACDPSGFGQGRTFLGFVNVTTDGSGNASYSAMLPEVVPAGTSVVATATDPASNTSEFSGCFPPLSSATTSTTTTTTTSATANSGTTSPTAATVTPRLVYVAKVQKDGSITLTGTTTVAGKVSVRGTVGANSSAAANKPGRTRRKAPAAVFGPVSKTLATGSFTLKLKPNSTALARLRAGKRLIVTVVLTLSPTAGGNLLIAKARVSDRLPRGHPGRHH